MTEEGKLKAEIRKLVLAAGGRPTAIVQTGYGEFGISDNLTCLRGRFIAIEAKIHKKLGPKNPTKHQRKYLVSVLDAGGCAFIATERNLPALKRFLERIR